MKQILMFLLFLSLCDAFAQGEKELLHEKFIMRMEKEKTKSTYDDFRKVKEEDANYLAALVYRNNFGWALDKIENLKEDIPAILKLPNFSSSGSYFKIFNPQKFPASEWGRFYEMSIVLIDYFKSDSAAYREVLATKVYLELIMRKDEKLLEDMPLLLTFFQNNPQFYKYLVREYANVLNRSGKQDEAELIYLNEYKKTPDFQFLNGLVKIYSFRKKYKNILEFSGEIQKDTVGVLLYQLAEAHLNVGDTANARKYFDLYISKITVDTTKSPVEIAVVDGANDVYYTVSPENLEQIGDFYLAAKTVDFCKYYQWGKLLLNQPTEQFFMNKLLIAIDDEKRKKELLEAINKEKEKDLQILKRLEVKIEKCR